jgi:cardiolipin synthase
MNLLYALPLLLLGTFDAMLGTISIGAIAHNIGWAFLIWGIAMYWYGAALYFEQVRELRL